MREEKRMLSINFSLRPNASDQKYFEIISTKATLTRHLFTHQIDFGRKFFRLLLLFKEFISGISSWSIYKKEKKNILSALERQTTGKNTKDILNHLFVCGSFGDIVT